MWETVVIAALLIGLIFAIGIIFAERWRSFRDEGPDIGEEIRDSSNLGDETKFQLMLEANRVRNESMPWYHRAASSMGVVAFAAALAAITIQAFQNAALQSQSQLEAEQLELFRAQNERAIAVVDPIVASVLDDFNSRGSVPSQSEKELLRFAVDRWLSQPEQEGEAYREEMLRAFRASLLAEDFPAAVRISDRLGTDIDLANKVDQIGIIEYLYVSGVAPSVQPQVCRLLQNTSGIPSAQLNRLFAIGLLMGLVDGESAARRASVASRVTLEAAANDIRRQTVLLRESRERVLAVLRGDGRFPSEIVPEGRPPSTSGCPEGSRLADDIFTEEGALDANRGNLRTNSSEANAAE